MKVMTAAQLLDQMKVMEAAAKSEVANDTVITEKNNFGQLFNSAINHVNELQKASSLAATQVERGDDGASLIKAMIASQKSSVAFEAAVQVRNRVVTAYQDIMNMPI
ncbi:MAG: flagellar hook-basal body complex protein FliE [Pseudomonadota bacterium]